MRDVWMGEGGENLALARHSLCEPGAFPGAVRQLQRHGSIDQAVGALRQPDYAHAAAAELAHQSIKAELLARVLGVWRSGCEVARLGFELELRQGVEKFAGFDQAGTR